MAALFPSLPSNVIEVLRLGSANKSINRIWVGEQTRLDDVMPDSDYPFLWFQVSSLIGNSTSYVQNPQTRTRLESCAN